MGITTIIPVMITHITTTIMLTMIILAITMGRKAGIVMLDDFFIRALLAGLGLALVAGPLGCFVIWRRMAYFGDTMAHSALLGVALSLLLHVNLTVAVFGVAAVVSLALLALQRRGALSTDALLGILSHSTLAIGLVLAAFLTWVRFDLMTYLFGDILAVGLTDIYMIWGRRHSGAAGACEALATADCRDVNPELAEAEGMQPERTRLYFMLLLALVIAIAIKVSASCW